MTTDNSQFNTTNYAQIRQTFELALTAELSDPERVTAILETVDDAVGNHADTLVLAEDIPHLSDPGNGAHTDLLAMQVSLENERGDQHTYHAVHSIRKSDDGELLILTATLPSGQKITEKFDPLSWTITGMTPHRTPIGE